MGCLILGAAEVLPYVDRDLKIIAAKVLEKAKQICAAKSVITNRTFHVALAILIRNCPPYAGTPAKLESLILITSMSYRSPKL